MKHSILAVVVLLLIAGQLISLVAFNGTNQRNHPELNWKSIDTANCRIIYHDPLEPQARQTAEIAQNTFNTLVKTYQLTPMKTCIIYVSDQDNVSNGAAALSFYIFIWVNQNDFTGMFTGNDKWIRKVVSHEISHWFVASSIEGWLTPLIPIVPTFPRNMNEGYAQYFSGEEWGYNRGDKYLKASILSRKTGIPSPGIDGNLMYADGFSKVRYLAAMYGEDSLIKLLKYRNQAKFYGFKEVFQKVYKKSYEAFDEEWQRYVSTYYFGEVYGRKATAADTTAAGNINDFTRLKTDYYQFVALDWKNDKMLYTAKQTVSQGYLDLRLADVVMDSLKSDKLKLKKARDIYKAGNFTKISLSENGKWAAFAVYTRHKHGRLAPRIFVYNVQKHKLRRLGEGNYPEVDSTGGVYFQSMKRYRNNIEYVAHDAADSVIIEAHGYKGILHKEVIVYSFGLDEQIGNLALSPDNTKLAMTVFDSVGKFNITILDVTTIQVIGFISLSGMAQSIKWNNSNELLYTLENPVNYGLDIELYNVTENTSQSISHPPYNAVPIRYLGEKLYVMADFDKGAKVPGSFVPQAGNRPARKFSENYYNKWINIKPIYEIPDSTGNIEISQPQKYLSYLNLKWRMGFVLPAYNYATGGFLLSEALGKHLLGAIAAIPYSSKNKAWWLVMYENKTLAPTLDLMYARQQWLSGVGEEKLYYQDMDKVTGKISFPINLVRPFRSAELGFDLSYTDVSNANHNPIFENKGFASFGSKTGYTYSLPWKKSELHKVRSCNAAYALQLASGKLGMNTDFNQHIFNAGFAYAPLLHKMSSEILRTVALENRTHYEFVNGDRLQQFLPGINQDDIVQSNYKPAFKRYYLRGYEENYLSKKILNVQNEINIKLFDDLGINVLNDMLSVHYTGLTLWNDHTELHQVLSSDRKNRIFNANGFEVRAETNLLFLPTVLKYGIAYNMDFEKLSDYFLIEIPFLELLQDNM